MTLKKCGCGKVNTTKNSKSLGKCEGALYINCECGSTLVLMSKALRAELDKISAATKSK